MNWRTDKPTADVIVANHTDSDIYDILRRIDGKYYLYTMFGAKEIPIDEIKKWADLAEEKIDKKIPLTNIDRQEQISQVADILFYNTETAQLSIEKCYELAEKIVTKRGASLREDEAVTDCHQLEEELDAFIKSGKAIKEENCGTYTTTYIDPLKVARHFAKWGAEHLKNKRK